VLVNPAAAAKWYYKSAVQGFPSAQKRLGDCLFEGWGIAEDKQEAAEWYLRAAQQGNKEAQELLQKYYYSGNQEK